MNFVYCLIYLIVITITIFLIGRFFPRRWIFESKFPFRSYNIEKDGKIYQIYENSKIMEIPGLFRQKAVAGHAIITVKQRFAVIYCTIRGKATKT